MKTNSVALCGGVCSANRINLTAREFTALRGPDALTAFLRAAAGVSRVEDVSESERFRVNAAMRTELIEVDASTPQHVKALARVGAKAFAKMVQRP